MKEKLNAERNWVHSRFRSRLPDFPLAYVLDGQQRLTRSSEPSRPTLTPDGGENWPKIYFDLTAEGDPQSR